MSDPFIVQLNERNLCSWYILPLLGLNIEQFGITNFIDAYQVKDQPLIAAVVSDVHLCFNTTRCIYYQQMISTEHGDIMLFEIPTEWLADYELFLQGKYSKLSQEAKQKIRELSGLKYEVPDNEGNKITDALLMVLDRNPVLVNKWMELLGYEHWEEHRLPKELLSLPAEKSFITLQSL